MAHIGNHYSSTVVCNSIHSLGSRANDVCIFCIHQSNTGIDWGTWRYILRCSCTTWESSCNNLLLNTICIHVSTLKYGPAETVRWAHALYCKLHLLRCGISLLLWGVPKARVRIPSGNFFSFTPGLQAHREVIAERLSARHVLLQHYRLAFVCM